MNDTTYSLDDERFLAPFIASLRADDDDALAEAAGRLRARLPQPVARRTAWRPLRFAALSMLITGLAISLPMMLPGGGGNAFAQVQQWFSDYHTLDVRTRIEAADAVIVDVRARVDEAGNTRVDQGDLVHIIDVDSATLTMLLPAQRFLRQPIGGQPVPAEALDWVQKLKAFRGLASDVDEVRRIDGRQARGHRLILDGVDLTLWSDPATDQPLLLEGALPGGLQLETRFRFNLTLSPDVFEVPPGYLPVDAD